MRLCKVLVSLKQIHHTTKKKNVTLTSNGVCGAVIEPIYPQAAQIPINPCLKFVGNNSVVYTYVTLNEIDMAHLLIKNIKILIVIALTGMHS